MVFDRLTDHGHLLLKTYGTVGPTPMSLDCMDVHGKERAHPTAAETPSRFLHIQLTLANVMASSYISC